MCDDYSGYKAGFGNGITEIGGMAHARRNFYRWRTKLGCMDASIIICLKELEEKNRRLKKIYAEESSKAKTLKEAIEKKW